MGAEPDPKVRREAEVERRRARNAVTRKARKKARVAADSAVLAQNDRVESNAARRRSKLEATGDEPDTGSLVPGRRVQIVLQLEKRRVRTLQAWGYIWPITTCLFHEAEGRRVSWTGKNPRPVNVRGHRHPDRYPILRRVDLRVSAKVKAVEGDGAVVLSRPYIRLDRQSQDAKRASVERCGAPSDVGPDDE